MDENKFDFVLTVTTLSGKQVKATLASWVQSLILQLPPDQLVEVMQRVERAQSPITQLPHAAPIRVDHDEFLRSFGRRP